MARYINERIKHADTGNSSEKKEQEPLLNNFYFSNKIFPCKRSNDDSGRNPAIKSKSDRLNCFDHTSCDNKITGPDKGGEYCERDSNKNLALVMGCVIH